MTYTKGNLVNVLANGLAGQLAFVDLDFNKEEYAEVKQELNDPSFEEVLVSMLTFGHSIYLIDEEGKKYELTLDKLLHGVEVYFQGNYGVRPRNFEQLENFGDFYDNEGILQCAIFGDCIYG